jgi:hypothetical protein
VLEDDLRYYVLSLCFDFKIELVEMFGAVQSHVLPPFQIIRYSKNLGESKHLKFDQNYRENYKNL